MVSILLWVHLVTHALATWLLVIRFFPALLQSRVFERCMVGHILQTKHPLAFWGFSVSKS